MYVHLVCRITAAAAAYWAGSKAVSSCSIYIIIVYAIRISRTAHSKCSALWEAGTENASLSTLYIMISRDNAFVKCFF